MNSNSERQRNWKGKSPEAIETVRHRWQSQLGTDNADQYKSPLRSLNRVLKLWLVLAIGLLSAFVILLLYSPAKTPVIAVGATKYSWPMPPIAWAKEDLLGLSSLNGKTIQFRDSSDEWQTKTPSLDDLSTQLKEVAALTKRTSSLVLYLNMHGAVNESGQPCLIPPGANALKTKEWISIDDVVKRLSKDTETNVNILVVLDCVHQSVNWNVAQVDNTFVDRLESWVVENPQNRIVFLTSNSPDQQSWGGPELHASAFGKEFWLGLAGAADQTSRDENPSSGNGDGMVHLHELTAYLASHVDRWSQDARGAHQVPKMIPSSHPNFQVALALKSGESKPSKHTELAKANVPADTLTDLWRMMDELRQFEVFRTDPKNWAELEHKILWLEQLSGSGAAYFELADKTVLPELRKQLKESVDRARATASSNNYFAKAQSLQAFSQADKSPAHLPSLAMMELTGEVSGTTAIELRKRLLELNSSDAQVPLNSIAASVGLTSEANTWNELNFIGILRKYDCSSIWNDLSVVDELLKLRDRSERLAVFGDVRGHRWRRPQLLIADQARRDAEDRIILGPDDAAPVRDSVNWSSLQLALDSLETAKDSPSVLIERALGIRDLGLSEVSYLANWICSPDTEMENLGKWKTNLEPASEPIPNSLESIDTLTGVNPMIREETAIQQLKQLMEGLHELGEMLGKAPMDGGMNVERLNDLVTSVEQDRKSLSLLVEDHVRRACDETTPSGTFAREIPSLLNLPFLSTEDRIALRNRHDQVCRTSLEKSKLPVQNELLPGLPSIISSLDLKKSLQDDSPESLRTEVKPQAKHTRYLDRIRNWETHPIGVLFKLKNGLLLESASNEVARTTQRQANPELDAIDLINDQLRRHYISMLTFNVRRISDWARHLDLKGEAVVTDESENWTKIWFAEHVERSNLPVCPVRGEWYATLDCRKIAFKDFLAWYAGRTLDDFYANAMEGSGAMSPARTYFENAVRDVLNYAETIPISSHEIDVAIQSIQERVVVLGPIARNGFKTSAKVRPPISGSDQSSIEISVQPTVSSLSSGKAWAMPVPEGQATALVRTPKGILPSARIPIPMPTVASGSSFNMTFPPFESSLAHESVVVYRGNEFKAPIFVGVGIVVDFEPKRVDSGEVILFGDRQRQPSIVFVLDCSWSMGEEIPVEAIDLRTQSRLELAKESILRMLAQIASRPDARVGLRLFGHRMGWSRPTDAKSGIVSGKSQILVQPNYPSSIPEDLVPSKDVEAILPLGRFTPEMIGGLAKKLSSIVPWGQSPLYLSIVDSFKDFTADDNATAKSIVIVTDGDNFQFNASNRPGGEPEGTTNLETVYRAWNNTKIPVFILGVGISESENGNTRKTLQELAKRTQGKYYDIENGSDLIRALNEQLAMGTYQVTRSEASTGFKKSNEPIEARLNSPMELKPLSPESSEYLLEFQSIQKLFQLKGGESLEMFVQEDGQDIVSKPYDRSTPQTGTLGRVGENGRLLARVHRPLPRQNGVVFPISIQDPDSHFTPRPDCLWIEISPVLEGPIKSRQSYVFYDTNYESKTPVPMVSWFASNWPTLAQKADVQVWAKFGVPPPLQTISISEIQKNAQRSLSGVALKGVDGVTLQMSLNENRPGIGKFEVQVSEIHDSTSLGVGSIGIYFESQDLIQPKRVTHRFESESGLVIHTFEFDSTELKALLQPENSRLAIRSRASIIEGAWQLQGRPPIRVEVRQQPETLPLMILPAANSPKN
ncbi:MAG: vWA domain-containing protein [Pirellula sp.]